VVIRDASVRSVAGVRMFASLRDEGCRITMLRDLDLLSSGRLRMAVLCEGQEKRPRDVF